MSGGAVVRNSLFINNSMPVYSAIYVGADGTAENCTVVDNGGWGWYNGGEYAIVDQRNPKRVLHALEICYMTGRTYTSFRTRSTSRRPFDILKIGLTRPREELYERINERVDQMMADGLLNEAQAMYERYVLPARQEGKPVPNALNTVGYKELFAHFDGEWTLDFAIDKIKQNTRIYSRKQMTWFKRDESVTWFHPSDKEQIIRHIIENLK